ncbi:MAG: hypothetical protein ACD_45C00613G0007 [uncultured bacterium]|nr:MAG: hypothetical protein ACD_45C00613G0007 [uncultured bacterium]
MRNRDAQLNDRLAALIEAMGYEFVGCELRRQGHGSLLRIYIDNEDGITLADCTKVSHQVSAMLDVDDPISGRYNLEISSPGLNRPLFGIKQYQKFIGKQVKIKVHNPINHQRNFVGMLEQVNETNVHLLVDAEKVVLPFSEIEKARVIADF